VSDDRPDTPDYAGRAQPAAHATTSPVLIALAWLFVGVPLAWGVEQTAAKSLDLFRAPAAQPQTQPATGR
jgi:hypothetical protein